MTDMKRVNADVLKMWLDNDEVVIVDVREPREYNEGHIRGSHLIPVDTLSKDKLPELNGKKLVVHCLFGKRGGTACEKLMNALPDLEVYNLEGGLAAWKNAGYEVEV